MAVVVNLQTRFPVNPYTGYVQMVPASAAAMPFTYVNALKLDANGCVVVRG